MMIINENEWLINKCLSAFPKSINVQFYAVGHQSYRSIAISAENSNAGIVISLES
jgi:hypothetical protein